jgi:hypothetical protein
MEHKFIQEFMQNADGTEGQVVLMRKIYDKVIEEADHALVPRSELALYIGPSEIPGSSVDIDLENANAMIVRRMAEGTGFPICGYKLTSTNVKPVKYGIGLRISREYNEDAKWPMLTRAAGQAGRRFADNETKLIILALDGAANTVSGGAAVTIANINSAVNYVEEADFNPTTILLGNEVAMDLRNIDTFYEADKAGTTEMRENGFIGRISGTSVLRFSTNAAPSATYAKYAYVYDRSQALAMAEKRPLTMEGFALPEFDMDGMSISQRVKLALLRSSSVAKITSS